MLTQTAKGASQRRLADASTASDIKQSPGAGILDSGKSHRPQPTPEQPLDGNDGLIRADEPHYQTEITALP